MTKTKIFTAAHALTRATLQQGDSYAVTFAAALRYVYAEQRKPIDSVAALINIGGNRWQKGDHDRIYFNDLADLIGLSVGRYGTGNISSASLGGERISNSKARRLLSDLGCAKVWYDVIEGGFHAKGVDADLFGDIREEIRIRAGV